MAETQSLQRQRSHEYQSLPVESRNELQTIVYALDILGDAADGVQHVQYPNSVGASFIGGAAGEHIGRNLGLEEGQGAKAGALAADLILDRYS